VIVYHEVAGSSPVISAWSFEFWLSSYRNSKLKTQNPKLKTQNPKLETQNPKLKTQNPNLKTQNLKLKTQNSKLKILRGCSSTFRTGVFLTQNVGENPTT
jgi:hypothetical protein